MNCNKETAVCQLEDIPVENNQPFPVQNESSQLSFYYFGDPMCSWCWGASEALSVLEKLCAQFNFDFNVITGGLRAGGGDVWNENFRHFLKKEWEHISAKTGKKFSYQLLERTFFEYDTEPACRAVNAAREFLDKSEVYSFFKSVQHKFYVLSEDPKEMHFYKSICEEYSIPFNEFARVFNDDHARTETITQFTLCRKWGVQSFPAVCFEYKDKLYPFFSGYISPENVISLLQNRVFPLIGRG